MFNNIVVVVVVFTVVMCTCLGDQSPSEILTGICNSSNSLFIECADLNVTQKSLFSDLLHSTTGASDEVKNSWKNPLEELSALPDMPHVAGLYLHGNAIRVIQSAAFHRLTALSHLDLSNNNLSRVGFLSAPAVQLPLIYLDLGYNQISSIDADAFHSIPHLKRLKLNNNPIVSLDGHTGLAITNLENLMVSASLIGHKRSTTSGLFHFLFLFSHFFFAFILLNMKKLKKKQNCKDLSLNIEYFPFFPLLF